MLKLFSSLAICVGLATTIFGQTPEKVPEPKVKFYVQNDSAMQVAVAEYEKRIKQSYLNGFYIPKDLNDCFKQLDTLMEEEVREKFKALPEDKVDARTHLNLGAWLEYKWEIKTGSRLTEFFRKLQVPRPEYMISIILVSYHRYLHHKDLDIKTQVLYYREMWAKKRKEQEAEVIKRAQEAAGGDKH